MPSRGQRFKSQHPTSAEIHLGKVTGCYAVIILAAILALYIDKGSLREGIYITIHLCQVWIRQNPLSLWNPEEASSEVQNQGISGPTNEHVANKNFKKKHGVAWCTLTSRKHTITLRSILAMCLKHSIKKMWLYNDTDPNYPSTPKWKTFYSAMVWVSIK